MTGAGHALHFSADFRVPLFPLPHRFEAVTWIAVRRGEVGETAALESRLKGAMPSPDLCQSSIFEILFSLEQCIYHKRKIYSTYLSNEREDESVNS